MILWIGLAVLCLLLHFAPDVIFNVIYNAFRMAFLLLKQLCLALYHLYEIIAANPTTHKIPGFMLQCLSILCGVLWVIIDLPTYIEDWIFASDNIDDPINTPTHAPGHIQRRQSTVGFRRRLQFDTILCRPQIRP